MSETTRKKTAKVNRIIRHHIKKAGYSNEQINYGLSYAFAQSPYSAREGYILSMSRILFIDKQLAAGERFAVECGFGPRP